MNVTTLRVGFFGRTMLVCLLVFCLPTIFAFPTMCIDPKPINLLGLALKENSRLPPGVNIVTVKGINGYSFGKEAVTFGVDSGEVFQRCPNFPTEFSVLINLRQPAPRNSNEYLVTLLAQDRSTVLFALRLRRNYLYFDLAQSGSFMRRTTETKDSRLSDGDWHNIIVTVARNTVKFTLDCEEIGQKMVIPVGNIDARGKRFYIASRRRKRERFTGVLRQLFFVPGTDVATSICPSDNPSVAILNDETILTSRHQNDPMPVLFQYESPLDTCSLRRKGQLLYTVDSSLKICTGEEFADIKSSQLRMDYIVDYEDIPTPNKTIDIEAFTIPDEGRFLATANKGGEKTSKSAIYKWNGETFKLSQEISSKEAHHWKFFTIGNDHFLALANSGTTKKMKVKSLILRWLPRKKKFVRHQFITTFSARSWEAFQIEDDHYLAVANHIDDFGNNYIDSVIYIWDADQRLFIEHQRIKTVGAIDVEFFKIELRVYAVNFLVFANTFNGVTTTIDSTIYRWEKGKFVVFQNIQTVGVADWEYFEIDGRFYLAAAYTVDFDSSVNHTRNYRINSPIFELNLYALKFVPIQEIPTNGANDWEFFTVGRSSYLAVSNIGDADGTIIRSVIYKWQGVERFVPVHTFTAGDTGASTDFEHIVIDGNHYLAQANPDGFRSKLFNIVTY